MPAASRSTTSSRMRQRDLPAGLRARLVVAHERPLQHRHRPGQHALHRLVGQRLRVAATSRTVIGCGRRHVAEDDRRLHAARAVALHPAVSVKAKPSSCSPKYSTMSLRSNSPCTSTSRPSCFLHAHARRRISLRMERVVVGSVELAVLERGARLADLRGLRERADGGGREARQLERGALQPAALRESGCGAGIGRRSCAARRAAHGRVVHARRRGDATRLHGARVRQRAPRRVPAPSSASASTRSSPSFCSGERQPAAQLGVELRLRGPDRPGMCSSEQDGASHSASLPTCPARSAPATSALSRSVRQMLRPLTMPSDSTRVGRQRARARHRAVPARAPDRRAGRRPAGERPGARLSSSAPK